MSTPADARAPLRDFVISMTRLVDRTQDEVTLLAEGRVLLAALIAGDRWLPEECARTHPEFYRQYLLHCDPLERFSVVSFVWGPGQKTPIHDHTVWGLIGMLRGAETSRRYDREKTGRLLAAATETRLEPGDIDAVSPRIGDVHVVSNSYSDQSSISIHVYGANVGAVRRHVFDPHTGLSKDFVSGYSADQVPNLWDRSAALRGEGANLQGTSRVRSAI